MRGEVAGIRYQVEGVRFKGVTSNYQLFTIHYSLFIKLPFTLLLCPLPLAYPNKNSHTQSNRAKLV
ncbi:hypothetical protein CSQ80_11480 [Cyanobacterium aponinum IPPAS B-1201]|nr:hypothetical protein CSQ80_11480 [Cyanobacterium aponinum IPPAS B-1201]